jgi:5,10-methylene-tetrahydrofolate dehydrogenase/methenyl tetrahydrofolate cyclohydrolase
MTESKIIDGKAFAEGMRRRIAAEVQEIKAAKNIVPGLAVVLVGEIRRARSMSATRRARPRTSA